MPWRVQATWTVGDDERRYPPIWIEEEHEARRMKAEVEQTLRHFPTLLVLLDQVDRATYAAGVAEDERRERLADALHAATATQPMHALPARDAATTVCGIPACESVASVITVAGYDRLSFTRPLCPACRAAATDTR